MRKHLLVIFVLLLCFAFSSCSALPEGVPDGSQSQSQSKPTEAANQPSDKTDITTPSEDGAHTETPSQPTAEAEAPEQTEDDTMKETQFYIKANGTTFVADFAENGSADALRELLHSSDLTVNMHDYGSFEKVGDIGQSLPREDKQTSTTTGDIVLYQGNQIVIFYGNNSWSYSRLGKIQNVTMDDLLLAFGDGNVTLTFSLTE